MRPDFKKWDIVAPNTQRSVHISVNYFRKCGLFFPIWCRALGLLSSFPVIFGFSLFPRELPWIMEEALWGSFGTYLPPLQSLVTASPPNTMLWGWLTIHSPLLRSSANAMVIIHHRGMEWTEGDRGLYISVMNSFISGYNPRIFIWSKLHVTHQALSLLTTSPYLKFPFVLFFPF